VSFSPALLARQVLLVAAIFGLWEWGVRSGFLPVYLYGQPSGVWAKAQALAATGELWRHTWVTAQEAVLGFLIGSGLGALTGLLLWLSPATAATVRPVMIAINGVPKIALAPLIIVWFGIGMEAKIAIAAILTFIVSLIATYAGTQEVDQDLVRLLRSLGATRLQTWRKVVAPATLPWIVSALRLNVGFALIGAVVGEYISAKEGLGYLVYFSGTLYDLNAVWTGIFALMILALLLDAVVTQVERRVRWR
jgi:NitT/TauT family transport system permease protein